MRFVWSIVESAGASMGMSHWRGSLLPLLTVLLVNVGIVSLAAAQGGVIAGITVDSTTRQPVAGVQISITQSALGAITDTQGRFRISGVPGANATLIARRIGYTSQRKTVAVGDQSVEFVLSAVAQFLEEVVISGTPTGSTKRELGNAITVIDVAEVTAIAPIQDFQQLLNGRAPSVVVMSGTGQVGGGAKIRVRGTSSLGLGQTPLIYVDGVRVNNAYATGPANQGFGSSTISRWNDIDPEDIEKVEIIRGPSAATLYGTEAANGLIQIITKHGFTGKPKLSFTMKQGVNYIPDPASKFATNYKIIGGEIQSINYDQLADNYQRSFGGDIFQRGHLQKYHLGVSGGSDLFRYYVAGAGEENEGAEPSNGLKRTSARANLTLLPREGLKAVANLSYLDGHVRLSPEAGYGGRIWTTVLMDPARLSDSVRNGFYSGTPWAYDQQYNLFQDVNRFTGGLDLAHNPTTWFSQRLTVGADQTNTTDVEFAPRVDSLEYFFGEEALGFRGQTANEIAFRTADYAATARFDVMPSLTSATSVGGQYYRTRVGFNYAAGFVFPAPGLSSVSATTTGRETAQDFVENATLGYYVQEQLAWMDRRYLTLALRSDKNSAFGKDFGRVYYPKASLSWVISDEPFWTVPFLSSLRLRTAYGETGQQPDDFAALRTYAPVTGPDDSPAVQPQSLGNTQLGPERGKEFEAGFETAFWDDRAGLEFTFYNKVTSDAILSQEIAPSAAFSSSRFINAGKITNRGIELIARVTPWQSPRAVWDLSFIYATNRNRIQDLGLPGLNSVGAGVFRQHREGYPVGAWFEQRVVSAEFDTAGKVINMMCAGADGGSVSCAGADGRFGTSDDAPNVYLGSPIPTREGAVSTTLTLFDRLKLYGLVDFQYGQSKLDGNLRIRCYFSIGGLCRAKVAPTEFDPVYVAGVQNSALPAFLISDAGFAKLREISASYSLPERWAGALRATSASVTLSGRNLFTWTDYDGVEPEASFLSGGRGALNNNWEQTVVPQLRTWVVTFNVVY